MTARSIRRAAERKAKKSVLKAALKPAALKAERTLLADLQPAHPLTGHHVTSDHARPQSEIFTESLCRTDDAESGDAPEPALFTPAPVSPAQLAANRANACLSTGPNTPEGKANSSLNAVKTALTGRTVLLPSDEAPAYQLHVQTYQEDFRPLGARECDLVQSIADTAWRLKRIPCLEAAIFALGHIECAGAFDHHDPSLRASMTELQTYLTYEKQIRNLQLQESRLARRREKELAELRQLQQERRAAEQETLELVANHYAAAQATGQPFESAANGFVFSTAQIEQYLERLQSRKRTSDTAYPSSRVAKHAA